LSFSFDLLKGEGEGVDCFLKIHYGGGGG
jgi:hypothetical protein